MSALPTSSNQTDDLDTLLQQITTLKRILGITGDTSTVTDNNAKRKRSPSPAVRNGTFKACLYFCSLIFILDFSFSGDHRMSSSFVANGASALHREHSPNKQERPPQYSNVRPAQNENVGMTAPGTFLFMMHVYFLLQPNSTRKRFYRKSHFFVYALTVLRGRMDDK
jgi:hypothetical protein